ncbi:hypothetical protein [Cyanobium sp. Morenito 9A2]|uniref:hypothetical protein n=1 Tax=Cyanobium sp. Morenito 9A2 TaxID=2823718 RepID=UPI0020CE52BC|nr:hypothetical protein [Cyanobium sp. Morenito 9A2]MCP9848209.1 hypothetical protein [Cyanobium sp. Morenito 9A2]
MAKATTSPAREQALRDSLRVRYAAAAAAGNIDLKKALNHEATYLGIQLSRIDGSPDNH